MAEAVVPVDIEDIELVDEAQKPNVDAFGMTPEEVTKLATQLRTDIASAEKSAEERYRQYEKWRRQVEAQPLAKLRSLNPLRNPSNIMPPLTQIHQQTMAANLINYFDQDPFWAWHSLKDDDEARVKATFLTKYFKLLSTSTSDLNLEPAKREICNETALMDKCVVKIPYTVHEWNYKQQDQTMPGADQLKTMVYHEGPELIPIPQEDFVFPAQWSDIRYMPWIAHIVHLPEHELVARGESGMYENVEDVIPHGRESPTARELTTAAAQGNMLAYFDGVYDLAEVYFYYDADGDGQYEDYIWTIDMLSGTVLRKQYNDLGMRPFEVFRYIERPHSLNGRGVGQICEGLQDEVEGIHNVRNDNMKIANMRMLSMSRETKIANGEELYPGKIWINDAEQEVKTIQLGEVYPSSLQAEEQTWQLAAQATGQSEVMRGFGDPTLGQRDTFRGQQMRMNSAKGLFGTIADGMKESFSRVGLLIMLQLINHKDEVLAREQRIQRLTPEELTLLATLLDTEPSDVPNKFAYSVATIDQSETPGAQLQAISQFAQMYTMWGQQSSQLAMQLFTPQGQQMQQVAPQLYNHLLTLYTGSARLMEQVLKLAGIEDKPGAFIPNTDVWEHMLSVVGQMQQAQLKQMEAQNGQRSLGGADQNLTPTAATGDVAGFAGGTAGAPPATAAIPGGGARPLGPLGTGAVQLRGMGSGQGLAQRQAGVL